MIYTIGQVSELTGLSIHTLRYYEKEGLLPSISRNGSGMRRYAEKDLEALEFIGCLRATGMTISDIKRFVHHTAIDQRLAVLEKQKETVMAKMDELLAYQNMIDRKIDLYMKMRLQQETLS
ncbi:MerR family transcriptional regulator [Paenibacillus thailandensis]|uniref:MerR family transcriptional regulator n=1 Tax=Paenibacillus thailandensis TaxID=393250 RepID=A0ABW5R0U4_9BACL